MRNSEIATFADDTKIFSTINSDADALNASECEVLRVTHNKSTIKSSIKHNKIIYPYKISCGTVLPNTDCERDLGIPTSPDLTWTKHIDQQCNRANKVLLYIRRSALGIGNTTVRRTLHLSLFHAQLSYGSQIPQTITTIQQAEGLQRRAIKFILNLPFRYNRIYKDRLLQLEVTPLVPMNI